MIESPDILLIDCSAVLFRSYHSMPPLNTSGGEPTGAIKGFINTTKLLEKRFPASQIIMIFDSPGPSFRHQLYQLYKANRGTMPEDLAAQIEPIFTFIESSGYPLVRLSGYEADDIIATYSQQLKERKKTALIVSNDKDLAQLVNEHIEMYDSTKNLQMDREGVFEKFKVWPEQIRDYLVLIGDSSDNIPGVPSVGAKTASKWLATYGSLEAIIENQQAINGKVGEKLRASVDEVIPLAKKLVNLDYSCPLELSVEELTQNPIDEMALQKLSEQTEINIQPPLRQNSVGAQQVKTMPAEEKTSTLDYETVTTREQLSDWLQAIKKEGLFALDTETDGLDTMRSKLVGMSLALQSGRCCYVPLAHKDGSQQLDKEQVLQAMSEVFSNNKIRMVGQNIKFDMHILASNGVKIHCQLEDSMLQSYCLDSTKRHDLNSLSKRLLSWQAIEFETIVGKGKNQKKFDQIPVSDASAYAAEDAFLAMRLYAKQQEQLDNASNARVKKVYSDIEVALIPVLFTMERNGACIDSQMLAQQSQQLNKQLVELTTQCHQLAGMAFNVDSPKQLQTVLFEHLKLPSLKKTATGQISTSEEVLSELALNYELPKKVIEYRTLRKLKGTYTDKLPLEVNPDTGRLHSSFNQTVASTGRLSSSNPNLQNIPIRTQQGREIRKAFIAEPGNLLISADYSQIELRIMAHLSKDDGLLNAFAQGKDIHKATAAEIFQTPLDEVDNDQRRSAKAINFGLIYGMSAFGLSKQLGTTRAQAAAYMESYFDRYPGVIKYMESTKERAQRLGYVETLMGRRLYLKNINSKNVAQKQGAERAAINAPLQGTAADIIKTAMIRLNEYWSKEPRVRIILQVHDELIFEVPEAMAKECQEQISNMMSQAIQIDVPLLVDSGVGHNWLEAH